MDRERAAETAAWHRRLWRLGAAWAVGLLASGWRPFDRATWWMEVAPVLIAWPALVWFGRSWRLSGLSLALIAAHGAVLMLGGAYTYARVPVGGLVQDWLALDRNPYDRFGHLVQGFVPAVVLREVLVRRTPLGPGALLTTLALACCLAISAAYELLEFAAARLLGQGADAFLGAQGDPWDTQWDMTLCLIGAVMALTALSGVQDRALAARGPGRAYSE